MFYWIVVLATVFNDAHTLQDLEEDIAKVFYETAADIADLPFGVTGNDEIFSKYEISGDTVLLIRKVRISFSSRLLNISPHISIK